VSGEVLWAASPSERLGANTRTIQRWAAAGLFPNAYTLAPDISNSLFVIRIKYIEALEQERQERRAAATGK
jgi:hypothetical protein